MRATVLGGRAWGSGYYGWPVVDGIQAMALNVACAAWLARALAALERAKSVTDKHLRKVATLALRHRLRRAP